MAMKSWKPKKIAAAFLAGVLGVTAIGMNTETVSADGNATTATNGVHATYQNVTDSSTDKLITWNKINSQADYNEFFRLLKSGSEVPLLLVFTDFETGERYVIGGENMQKSETYVNTVIGFGTESSSYEVVFNGDDHETKLYWITSEDSDGTVGSAVQEISATADGFSAIRSGADHVVTYGSTGSFTAVADTSTTDTEDFILLVNNTKNEKQYLQCREGFAIWWEETHAIGDNEMHSMWTLPILSVESMTADTKITYYAESAIDSWDSKYAISSANLKYSGSWKLGTWAESSEENEGSWSTCYIYQEASPIYGVRKKYGYGDMNRVVSGLDYTYCVLSAQCHSNKDSTEYSFFTAAEWVSKTEISNQTGPKALYHQLDSTEMVLGGPRFTWNSFISDLTGADAYREVGCYLNCGFEVYYGVEGVSLNAFREVYGKGNANTLASDQNVAGVTYLKQDWTISAPRGNTEASLNNSIYTVSKNEVLIVPEGVLLTVEKGATLIISGGGMLVLNGGIKNQGTIIVQKNGLILRYDSDGEAEQQYLVDKVNPSVLPVWWVNHGASALNVFGHSSQRYSWDRTSCLLLDGGNLIVRANARIRVTNLVLGGTNRTFGWTTTIGHTQDGIAGTVTFSGSPGESKNGSTVLNYGYILASCIVSYSNSDLIVESGRIDCGEQFRFDLINQTESSLTALGKLTDDTYLGLNYIVGSPDAAEGTTYFPWTVK